MNNIIRIIGLIFVTLFTLTSQAAITATDSLGQHQLPETPKRIVAFKLGLG